MPKSKRSLHELEEERVVPGGEPRIFAWHRARYEFAISYVGGRVLDVGCGEGYGAAILAKRAQAVVGIDYSPTAIQHARQAYESENLRFMVADVTLPLPDLGQFDVITCFEVIEHIENHDGLLANLARALSPGGWLIMSTPNALVENAFEAIRHEHYEYHVNVLTPSELRSRLRAHFSDVRLYGQSLRRSGLHTTLKAIDPLNLRHRLVRSPRMQERLADPLSYLRLSSVSERERQFRFSRMLMRQSSVLIATARSLRAVGHGGEGVSSALAKPSG
jgi:2-polyprenyl-3-methyl-5-hydroxy-6-metoxy-1,4-benzoquinol methylase